MDAISARILAAVQIIVVAVFIYPSRAMPLVTLFSGVGANAVILKNKAMKWYHTLVDEIKDGMQAIDDLLKDELNEMLDDADYDVKMIEELFKAKTRKSKLHKLDQDILKGEIVPENYRQSATTEWTAG